jgi:hypothetical protein
MLGHAIEIYDVHDNLSQLYGEVQHASETRNGRILFLPGRITPWEHTLFTCRGSITESMAPTIRAKSADGPQTGASGFIMSISRSFMPLQRSERRFF